jgi:Zn-dependent protease with chaperone function
MASAPSLADPGNRQDGASAPWRPALRDPATAVPSGTSVRFAALVLVLTASTGSIFDYLWQLSRPSLEARTHACVTALSTGPLGVLVARLARESVSKAVASAACVRPYGGALTEWSLTGVAILVAMSLTLYLLTPWWIIKVGRPGGGPLKKLDSGTYPGLTEYLVEQADKAGLERRPRYYIDWAGKRSEQARAFGYRRWPCVRLNGGLVVALSQALAQDAEQAGPRQDRARARQVLLHELAHLRNRDNLPTYLTLAAWRAFMVLIPAAYLAMLAISRTRPANPGTRIIITAVVLIALVVLSTRAVLRSRELHADATAAHIQRGTPLDDAPPSGAGTTRMGLAGLLAGARRLRSYHPGQEQRAAVRREPERLYRPDPLAMVSAGVAIAIIGGEIPPALISAMLGSLLRPGSALLTLTGVHPLELILLTFGPTALITAILVAALASAAAWRREYLASVTGAGPRFSELAWFALPMTAGILVGIPLNFDYVNAGTWGAFDSSLTRNLIVAAVSAAVLAVTVLAAAAWSREGAAVWFTTRPRRSRRLRAAMLVTGSLGIAPAALAWAATSGLPLMMQVQVGADWGQRPYIGTWPAVTAVSTHLTALGAFDIVPGSGFLLALPCLFVAARSLRAAGAQDSPADPGGRPRVPVAAVLATGLTAAGISVAAGLALMLSLRTVIGAGQISRAGGFGLLYLNRVAEAVIAACAGIGAAWVARRAGRTPLTSGILTALVTATAAAVLVPKLVFLGELRWGYRHVNPTAYPTLYGIAGNMTPGKAVAVALVLVAAGGAASRVRASFSARRAGPGSGTAGRRAAHARTSPAPSARATAAWRLAAALGFTAMLAGLAFAGYLFFTRGFS